MLKKRVKNLAPLALLVLVALIYSNVMGAPFIFDDLKYIVGNAFLRDLSNFQHISGTRYVVFFSFALNYVAGGLGPGGYHLVNIAIHGLNSIVVYFLVRALFETPSCSSGAGQAAHEEGGAGMEATGAGFWIAITTALIFAAHPLETEAVAYVSQRFASLVALFYLLSLYCYVRSRFFILARKAVPGLALFVLAFILGLLAQKSKETAFTLPLLIILTEFFFFQRGASTLKDKGGLLVLPFFALFAVIPLELFSRSGAVTEGIAGKLRLLQLEELATLSRSDYLLTQFRVIVTYIRLLFFPLGQSGDYDYTIYKSFFTAPVFFSFIFLLIVFVLGIYLALRSARTRSALGLMAGFGILWFFITISVESSIVPIKDVIFEHRVYLPSAGFFLCITSLYFYLAERGVRAGRSGRGHARGVLIVPLIIVLILSVLTYSRNRVWTSDMLFWSDVVSKSPQGARGYNNLGNVYFNRGNIPEAMKHYRRAITIDKEYYEAYNNLGSAYLELNQGERALELFKRALALRPDYVDAAANRALVLVTLNRPEEALRVARIALGLRSDFSGTHGAMGMALVDLGRVDEGIRHLQEALRLDPASGDALNNLGLALMRAGRFAEAVAALEKAAALRPSDRSFAANLAMAREALKKNSPGKDSLR
ncbi:MAG: tetratricopeptide repeat protein [Thermodesulfobacteriota bacterium]